MGKIIKAKKGGGIESKVIEEYTPLAKNTYPVDSAIHLSYK